MKMFAVYPSSKTNCIFAFLDKIQQKPPPIFGIQCSELMPSSLHPKLRVPVADFDHISPTSVPHCTIVFLGGNVMLLAKDW